MGWFWRECWRTTCCLWRRYFKSTDDGKTWKNMGLKNSEHISEIIVHPDNSDVVWVAVSRSLWSKGGERGLYKTTNGGTTGNKF